MRYLLRPGDEVRIITPSYSGKMIPDAVWDLAVNRLEALGLKVSFGKYVKETDLMESSSIKHRLDDLHEAFVDKKVKGVICAMGGYNSNFLLDVIDWKLIKDNPKFFGGMSDITVLCSAIYKMTGMETYQMPNFRNFGQKLGLEYTLDCFKKVAMIGEVIEICPSSEWSDDKWAKDQDKRKFIANEGWWVVSEGDASGLVVGGNLCSLNLLQGTKYMPSIENNVLFIEDDLMSTAGEFSRNLRSLMHLPGAKSIKALVVGRFQKKTKMTKKQLEMIVDDIPELKKVPTMANVDFGHTDPKITWVVGGEVEISVNRKKSRLILK